MTTEEKAKAYDEALERAKAYHRNELSGSRKEMMEYIFPQLRESEDERIRKKLYNTVMGTPNDSTWFDGTSKEAMLAWLEKQKEQKPPVDVDPCDASCDAYYQRGLNKGYELGLEAGRKEQKPAEKKDYSGLNDPERAILRGFLAAGIRNVPVGIIKETAKDCIAHFPWPTKWSKEDENTINELCNIIASNSKNGYLGGYYAGDLVQKLKSLRPQPKQEWSEEDERHRKGVLAFFNGIGKMSPYYEDYVWFKSLRPQPQGVFEQAVRAIYEMCHSYRNKGVFTDERACDFMGNVRLKCKDAIECSPILDEPHWKPSEEQMEMLKCTIDYYGSHTPKELVSLYEQLKKL